MSKRGDDVSPYALPAWRGEVFFANVAFCTPKLHDLILSLMQLHASTSGMAQPVSAEPSRVSAGRWDARADTGILTQGTPESDMQGGSCVCVAHPSIVVFHGILGTGVFQALREACVSRDGPSVLDRRLASIQLWLGLSRLPVPVAPLATPSPTAAESGKGKSEKVKK